jgi:endonuclease-8
MPEGDTIHRSARALERTLAGRRLQRFELRGPAAPRALHPRSGAVITQVEARGKHLLVHFDDGVVLHTHLGMHGSWHLYRAGERWRRPGTQARVILETDDGTVAVCFAAPTVETSRTAHGLRRVGELGPDLCLADADIDEALRRLGQLDSRTEIAVALLDQRVAAGIGNVYKSEACFACRVDPVEPVGTLDVDTTRALFTTAARMLRSNLTTARRSTVDGGLAVYGRAGRPCRRCGTPIRSRRQGELARVTYWCPSCQSRRPVSGAGDPEPGSAQAGSARPPA